jgi:hypothetical protein
MARSLIAVSALLLLSLTACSGAPMTDSTQPSATRRPFETTPAGPIAPTGTPVAVPPARWDAIVDDLAARGVTGTPTLVSSQAVTWNNGALGCPSPGQSYTQALVDGMQVIVTDDGTRYASRFGRTDSPKLCRR